jgi:hypothetical protein
VNLERFFNIIKFLYFALVIPLNVAAIIQFKDPTHMIILLGFTLGFIFVWFYHWERYLKAKSEFLDLAARIPQMPLHSKKRQEAHVRLLELSKYIPVHLMAQVFADMNQRDENILTDNQKEIIKNLRANKEIFYSPENPDIQHLIKLGWLIPGETRGEYLVRKSLHEAP